MSVWSVLSNAIGRLKIGFSPIGDVVQDWDLLLPSPEGFPNAGAVGCRLSLSSLTPYPLADIVSDRIYLHATQAGGAVPLLAENGMVVWFPISADGAPISLRLSALPANSAHDLYLVCRRSAPALVRVPWSGGSPAIPDARQHGRPVNGTDMTGFLSCGTPVIIEAKAALLVGSVMMSRKRGVARCDVSYGRDRQWGVWNMFNRDTVTMRAGDPVHTYQGRPLNNLAYKPLFGDDQNAATVFCGRPSPVDMRYLQATWRQTPAGQPAIAKTGIGWNSVTAVIGNIGQLDTEGNSSDIALCECIVATAHVPDAAGVNRATMLNQIIAVGGLGVNTGLSCIFWGDLELDQVLYVRYAA